MAWELTGNGGTNPATSFLGTTDAQPVVIKTGGTEKLRILPSGNVGIGNPNPGAKLEIADGWADPARYGSLQITREPNNHTAAHLALIRGGQMPVGLGFKQNSNVFGFGPVSNNGAFNPAMLAIEPNGGKVGVGTSNPVSRLAVVSPLRGDNTDGITFRSGDAHTIITHQPGGSNAGKIQVMAGGSDTAIGTTPYHLMLQPQGGNVGIGVFVSGANPVTKLEVVAASPGDGIRVRGSSSANISPGLLLSDEGGERGALGLKEATSHYGTDGGPGDIVLRATTGKLFLQTGDGSATMTLFNGNVGIGTTSTQFKLDVAGQVRAADFLITSDARLKTDVQPLTGVLDKLASIRGVSFEWNDLSKSQGLSKGKKQIGVIAQELEAVYPELVARSGDQDYRAVDYNKLTTILIEAIKELRSESHARMSKLESELGLLCSAITS